MRSSWDGSPDVGEQRAAGIAKTLTISDWKPRKQNTLQGFCTVTHPSGLVLHDVAIHQNAGSAWAMPPSKPKLKDGVHVKDANGKLGWQPLISFVRKEHKDRWSDQVIAALRAAHPEALS